jgi:Ca2+ transporting ATPase
MNITGTALAKDASDIILIDDNFASIITAIKWGRNIYDCIRKFLQFQLTVNAVALFMVFLGAVVIEQSPLTAIQMLWVNLIMDTLAALALATAKPDLAVLNKTPYSRDEYIVTADMAVLICGTGLFQMAWLLVILFLGPSMFSIEASWGHTQWTVENGRHFTIFFNVFVFLQVFNEINATKLLNSEFNVFKGILSNGLYVAIMIGTVVVQIVLVQFGG